MEAPEITDEIFDNFLRGLGVETYNKSFEWLFNDKDFSQILFWLYHNLDQNNALNTHEEYRYAELEASNALLSPKDLEYSVATILEEYKGLCLPGDKDGLDDMKREVSMLQERLGYLEKEESILNKLLNKMDKTKEQVGIDVTKLNSALHQCKDDEESLKEECIKLSHEVESATDDVVKTVAEMFSVLANCDADKEIADKFLAYGPYDVYRHKQEMFRSHYDSYVSTMFGWIQNDKTEEELKVIITEAKMMEDRLANAIFKYIGSRAEVLGEQAKLNVLSDFISNQIVSMSPESQQIFSEHQAESLLEEIRHLALQFVTRRTKMVTDAATEASLVARERITNNLNFLHSVTSQSLALDKTLYQLLRREFGTVVEFLQFSDHLRIYLLEENEAVASRIASMKRIQEQQEAVDTKMVKSNPVALALSKFSGSQITDDVTTGFKAADKLRASVVELRHRIEEACNARLKKLDDFKTSTNPLVEYIWDGSTKQPNCRDSTVAALTRSLTTKMANTEAKVVESTKLLATVKNGDKDGLRKLWQWFLSDQERFLKEVKLE